MIEPRSDGDSLGDLRTRLRRRYTLTMPLLADVRHAIRLLVRRPAVSVIVVVTLAVGIGAATVAFSVADAVLWHPLPFRHADRLARVMVYTPDGSALSALDAWPRASAGFEGVYPFALDSGIVTGGPEAEAVTLGFLAPGLLEAIGVRPDAGRTFTPDEAVPRPDVVLISRALWRRLAPGQPPAAAIGRTLRLENVPQTIVGVMSDAFDFPVGRVALWRPYRPDPGGHRLTALGIGRTPTVLTTSRPGEAISVTPFVRKDRTATLALELVLAAAVLLLGLAVANAANVLLADAVRRDAELAIRASLGATWLQLARQVAFETLALSAVAAGVALVCGQWALAVIVARIPYLLTFQALRPIALDWRALVFGVVAATLAGLGASWLSVARARRLHAATTLRGQGWDRRDQSRARYVLTAGQLAVALALVACAGLLATSLRRLSAFDRGFDATRLVHVVVQIPTWRYADAAEIEGTLGRVRERVASLPGVADATITYTIPTGFSQVPASRLQLPSGGALATDGEVAYARIDSAFLGTVDIPLVEGRAFDSSDAPGSMPVAIVSRALAARLAPDGRAIGLRFRESPDAPWLTVVGVVGDIANGGLGSSWTTLAFYTPRRQSTPWWFEGVVARTQGAPERAVPAIRDVLREIMPEAPVIDVTTGSEAIANSNQRVDFAASLMSTVAGLALVVALVGVYATFWYTVRQRAREIGVRLALGASPADIRRMVLWRGARLTLTGLAAGLPLALLATHSIRALVALTGPSEPIALATITASLAAAAILATYLPARRASRIDPVRVLRQG